jgi:mRNA-degrading endonuclease RelE of RelBE toxin-antitoxin system
MFALEITDSAEADLAGIRPFDGRIIMRAVETQLVREPTVATRARKALEEINPPFDAVPPVWELRVGEYRVFYDVNEEQKRVFVRAVRRKPAHRTTEDIL